MSRLRVAIVADYPEEGWPSMDLTARMILDHLARRHADEVKAELVCPPFRRRFGRSPIGRRVGHNIDRMLNRHGDYPRYLRRLARRGDFDVYHVVDHSYAQLVDALPAGRTVVTCHDLDTFRCLIAPDVEPRPAWFRALTRRTMRGLGHAAQVACSSETTAKAVVDHRLADRDRVHMVHLGTHPEYIEPSTPADISRALDILGPPIAAGTPFLLHVGSNIPRKRIDVLLGMFAGIRREVPEMLLVRIGGELTAAQADQAHHLGIDDAIRVIPRLDDRRALAAIYRSAAIVLQPSEAEGFGLPLAEAMACGAPLLISDIPVLREVAAEAGVYRNVGDVPGWTEAAVAILRDRAADAEAIDRRRAIGVERSGLYRWDTHVSRLVALYRAASGRIEVVDGTSLAPR